MLASTQAAYYRDRHQEDPHVQNDVDNVGGVGEGDLVDTDSLDGSPPGRYGPAAESQSDLHAQEPYRDHRCSPGCKPTKERSGENAVVECENRKLCGCDGNVIKVAEDIVSLCYVMWLAEHSEVALRTNL